MARFHVCFLFAIALGAYGCSGSDTGVGNNGGGGSGDGSGSGSGGAGDALFQTPASTSATPDSIFGLWGGTLPAQDWKFDSRVKFDDGAVTFATKCNSPDGKTGGIASVTSKARVSNDDISVLESKTDEKKLGDVTCRANTAPGETKRCDAADKGFEHDCFTLDGTSLTMFGTTTFDKLALTKISD